MSISGDAALFPLNFRELPLSSQGDTLVRIQNELRDRLLKGGLPSPEEKRFFQGHQFSSEESLDNLQQRVVEIGRTLQERFRGLSEFVTRCQRNYTTIVKNFGSTGRTLPPSQDLIEQAKEVQDRALKFLMAQTSYLSMRQKVQQIVQTTQMIIEAAQPVATNEEMLVWLKSQCASVDQQEQERTRATEERSLSRRAKVCGRRVLDVCQTEARASLNLLRHPTEIPGAIQSHPLRVLALSTALLGWKSGFGFTLKAMNTLLLCRGAWALARRVGKWVVS